MRSSPAEPRENGGLVGSRRLRWPLWSVAVGVFGLGGHLLTAQSTEVFRRNPRGEELVDLLEPGRYHLGAISGIAALLCLLVLAACWSRWCAENGKSAALTAVPFAFTASAAAMIFGYGVQGSMAIYLPGGMNGGDHPRTGLYVLYMFLDLGPFMAWWGVAAAALFVCCASLVRRDLPILVGLIAVIGWLPAVGMLVVTGLPGFPGITGPFWMILNGLAMAWIRQPAERTPAG